jgi:hypothetical protein
MVELQHAQFAGSDKFYGIEGELGFTYDGLGVRNADTEGPANAKGPCLIRQECDRLGSVAGHRDPDIAPAAPKGDRELR